eukprot:3289350-Heterocapsa_arctica.AAC.1
MSAASIKVNGALTHTPSAFASVGRRRLVRPRYGQVSQGKRTGPRHDTDFETGRRPERSAIVI